ncbi:MAG: hypothetical protein K2X77_33470 [Candidatus Obscuribacterales bacterium]|nr:hypothetical protein [Candidatus Obscuribacterales bacterium]
MTGFDLIAYGSVSVIALVAAGAIIPNPFRDKIRDTLSILTFGLINGATTEIQRAEARVRALAAELAANEAQASKITGSANHQKAKLADLKRALSAAEDNLATAMADKSGKWTQKDIDELTDKVGDAETEVTTQQQAVDDISKAADAVRLAVVKSAKELKKLQSKVKTAAVRDQATGALNMASGILKATKDFSNLTSDIGHDLDKIDEKYEQAKQRFEDAQGSETDRKIEEEKEKKQREDIRRRMEERAKNGGK